MALEITEMSYEQRGPKKPATQKGKLLSSMRKKYLNGVEVMDTELRKNVPVSQVRKEDAEFGRAMEKARVRNERDEAEFDKALKLDQSKRYGPVKAANGPRLDRSAKETPKVKPGNNMGRGSF